MPTGNRPPCGSSRDSRCPWASRPSSSLVASRECFQSTGPARSGVVTDRRPRVLYRSPLRTRGEASSGDSLTIDRSVAARAIGLADSFRVVVRSHIVSPPAEASPQGFEGAINKGLAAKPSSRRFERRHRGVARVHHHSPGIDRTRTRHGEGRSPSRGDEAASEIPRTLKESAGRLLAPPRRRWTGHDPRVEGDRPSPCLARAPRALPCSSTAGLALLEHRGPCLARAPRALPCSSTADLALLEHRGPCLRAQQMLPRGPLSWRLSAAPGRCARRA